MSAESSDADAFELLHPALRYHVVNSLGWPSLRDLQERAIKPLLDGKHALLIAPTAGGKTEAAVLPILSRMLSEEWHGVSVLYVCPIKALLNNLEPRLAYLAGLVGRRVAVWHGDITQGEKSHAESELPDILLTTPESLEGMFIGSRRNHQRLLGHVRCIIADELHAFAADDRGWHLLALLARIEAFTAARPQRIGLSATVGDPGALLDWFAGYTHQPTALIQAQAPPAEVDLSVDYVGSITNAAVVISRLHHGEKRLVFCDSRSKVEQLAAALRELSVDVFVSHAALSADLRAQAEKAFTERQNCVIVATSTLELGLDVGDLDRVIQIDAPTSVSSFLQRLGRTGRRAGSRRNTLFLETNGESLLECLAIIRLFRDGYVEPVEPPPTPYHVIVQQLFAALFEHGGEIEEQSFLSILREIPGFEASLDHAWNDIRGYLLQHAYLVNSGSFLSLGPHAESRFRGKTLADLCVTFASPRNLAVVHGNRVIGQIDPLNVSSRVNKPRVLSLAGRSWHVVSVDHQRAVVHVESTHAQGKTRWLGSQRGTSAVVSQMVRRILEQPSSELEAKLSRRAHTELESVRELMEDCLRAWPQVIDSHGTYLWWTWGGLAANLILGGKIPAAGGSCESITSWSIKFKLADKEKNACGGWDGLMRLPPSWSASTKPKFAELLPEHLVDAMTLVRTEAKAKLA